MNTISLSQLASISDLQRDYNGLINKVKKMAAPIFLLRRNEPEAVLISIDEYKELAEKKRLYELQDALESIAEFEKDKRANRLLTARTPDDLFKN
ncbi:MAG: type II toxin-antitoxin system prevent-host-death family antitoxin [Patescibacteria group bacterium]